MNEFKIIGRVNFIEYKVFESGLCLTRVLLSKKVKEEYQTYPITFFNTKDYECANEIAENIKKGDYIKATGKLNINKFKTKTGQDVENIELIGFGFKKVVYSESEGKYIETIDEVDNDKFSTTEKTPIAEGLDDYVEGVTF